MASDRDKLRRRAAHRGLTLMEMIVAMLLMATLLAGLWSLLHIVTRLFGTGSQVAVEAQLVRSLVAQFQTDLQSVIPPPEQTEIDTGLVEGNSTEPSGRSGTGRWQPARASSGSLPHFGLVGDSRSLYLSVLQAARPSVEEQLAAEAQLQDDGLGTEPALQGTDFSVSSEGGTLPGTDAELEERAAFAPELRMVAYTFRSPLEPDALNQAATEPVLPSGLVRRDVPWEKAPDLVQVSRSSGTLAPTVASGFNEYSVVGQSAASDLSTAEDWATDVLSEQPQFGGPDVTVVPEVVDVQFRYFDGQTWQSSWDSLQSGKLPLAVEVTFRVLTQNELKEAREQLGLEAQAGPQVESAAETGTLPTGALDESTGLQPGMDGTEGEAALELPSGRTYRAVIYLPAAQQRPTASGGPADNGEPAPQDILEFTVPGF